MTVTAIIDVSTPTGRRIVRELEKHKRVVKIISEPEPDEGIPENTIPLEAIEKKMWDKLEEHYGVDLRKL